jgi:hypothetical protein
MQNRPNTVVSIKGKNQLSNLITAEIGLLVACRGHALSGYVCNATQYVSQANV